MENTLLEEKVKNLEVELSQARTQIERMSSAKLDEVLSAQKPSFDKTGLGYVVSSPPQLLFHNFWIKDCLCAPI